MQSYYTHLASRRCVLWITYDHTYEHYIYIYIHIYIYIYIKDKSVLVVFVIRVYFSKTVQVSALNDIHNQLLATSVGGANGSIVFMCQRYYALMKELGLDQNNTATNQTCIPAHKTNNQVISCHTAFLRNKFNLVVDEEHKKLCNTGPLNFINICLKPDL